MYDDAVDISLVPQRTLANGLKMPGIGLGTFGSDKYGAEQIAAAVHGALRSGYRLIDCAACYGNEDRIGPVFEEAFGGGLKREEAFIISKVWNDSHGYKNVIESCEKSLKDLRLDYLDGYLVHWPFPNYHAPGCDGDSRNPDSRPYIHEEFMDTWAGVEELVKRGLVRNPGVSNVTIPKLRLILRDAKIKPVLNEMELHPSFQQGELFQFSIDNGLQPIGYCPIGSPSRPERDRSDDDVNDMEMPQLVEIAKKHNVHPALICLKWACQRGQVPIPFSVKPPQYLSNLRAVTEDPLTREEMNVLRSLDRNARMIKGQVFLWPGAKSWLDLWDVDGRIPSWEG
ncbi:MAG: aldo/keto reductase [Clostridia bacterium]|nr:aldo/keto reductase [Clostridia bacterium]